ncbi:MAG: hypothetical protein M3145_02970, partial [Pseudomonadota bacterium]|nr:hypothetical protein [Pseudomonadota bacterium]
PFDLKGRAASHVSAQRFVSLLAAVYNTFNVCRQLTSAGKHCLLRAEAFAVWREAAGVAVWGRPMRP